jgi:hypothetical protein
MAANGPRRYILRKGLNVMKILMQSLPPARLVCACLVAVLGAALSTAQAAPPAATLAASLTAQAGYGTIKGRLVWESAEVPALKVLVAKGEAQKDPQVCARAEAIPSRELVVDPSSKGVQYGYAYLVNPQGEYSTAAKELVAKASKVEIDQKNCEFIPHVSAMHQSQGLVLKSSDPVTHNIRFTSFTNGAFNQVLSPNGQVDLKLVAERRPIPLACDIHPWMRGYVMVFAHPYFAVTGEDGSFEITDVPAGAQNLVLWQERVGFVNQGGARGVPVEVAANRVTNVGDIQIDPAKVK